MLVFAHTGYSFINTHTGAPKESIATTPESAPYLQWLCKYPMGQMSLSSQYGNAHVNNTQDLIHLGLLLLSAGTESFVS